MFSSIDENCLVLTLARHELGERRSIVVMENSSTHARTRTKQLTNGTGACLLHDALFSPDLNPIELVLRKFKSSLKRNYELVKVD